MSLSGAVVGGDLVIRHATLTSELSVRALVADNLTVKGNASLDEHFKATGAVRWRETSIGGQLSLAGAKIATTTAGNAQDPTLAAALCLSGATVGARLVLRGAELTSTHGSALMADYLTVKGDAFCCDTYDGVSANGRGPGGAVVLAGASITGRLAMGSSSLVGEGGPALNADLVTVQQGVFLDTGFVASGAVRLWGATISGQLSLAGAVITNSVPGDALDPTRAAAVCLSGATIGGRLVVRRAALTSTHGSALMADYLTVKGDTFLCETREEGFTAEGAGNLGAVCLAGATVAGQLSLSGTTLTNTGGPGHGDGGPALLAESATVAGDILLDEGFTARATNWHVAVSLMDVSVGKQLTCVVPPPAPPPAGEPPASWTWSLARAKAGTFTLDLPAPPSPPGGRRRRRRPPRPQPADILVNLDGLTYTGLPLLRGAPRPPAADWIEVLQRRACDAAQPYEALAAAYEAVGDDPSARQVLIAQRDDTRRRVPSRRPNRIYQSILKATIAYGFRSIRAIAWLALLFAVTIGCSLAFGHNGWIVQGASSSSAGASSPAAGPAASSPTGAGTVASTGGTVAAPARCTPTGDIAYAINLAFPIINLGSTGEQCDVATAHLKWEITAFGWVVRALAATLAGFYAAGLAGITRNPPQT